MITIKGDVFVRTGDNEKELGDFLLNYGFVKEGDLYKNVTTGYTYSPLNLDILDCEVVWVLYGTVCSYVFPKCMIDTTEPNTATSNFTPLEERLLSILEGKK